MVSLFRESMLLIATGRASVAKCGLRFTIVAYTHGERYGTVVLYGVAG